MDVDALRESENNVEDRRTDEPLPPDWLTQQERPDLPPGVIGSDAYLARRKREGLIRSGYTSLDPQQLQYQIYATHGSPPPNPYNMLVGQSPPQRQPFPVGKPQNFYDVLTQRFGAVPGAPPSDLKQFRSDASKEMDEIDSNTAPGPVPWQEDDQTVPLPRPRPSEHEGTGLPSQADEEDMPPDMPFKVLSPSKIRLGPANSTLRRSETNKYPAARPIRTTIPARRARP
jgi:hypothetical protein